jgi:murein DD-endopeptidase MepM/ murein hydrolase activator NlpD
MAGRRYTVLIADRSSGVVRRLTINLRLAVIGVACILMIPVLIGLGAKWSANAVIDELQVANDLLLTENGSYRTATGTLTTQIQSLENVINELGKRTSVDPAALSAIQKLPAVIKARAAGGGLANAPVADVFSPSLSSMSSPEDTFGVLRDLLSALENRLRFVRHDVEAREALAAAVPSIWPTHGWLTGSFGNRTDPVGGASREFHSGIDISADKGQPVRATAAGVVDSAAFNGDYGNMVVLRHGFGLTTRYGHLQKFAVKAGQAVKRGDVIGYVGSTGRSTGNHLHYEILANGALLNPLKLLTGPAGK